VIGLLQRVRSASVSVESSVIGAIARGVLVLVAVEAEDGEQNARRLVERILGYRVFPDAAGRMNLSVADIGGGLLLVPQFTLAADTRKGTRASFTRAAEPARAERLFDGCVAYAHTLHPHVARGRFGADMQVALVNDGPVTFWLEA